MAGLRATARLKMSVASRMSGFNALQNKWRRFTAERRDYSFWIFSPDDRFRRWCAHLTSQGGDSVNFSFAPKIH